VEDRASEADALAVSLRQRADDLAPNVGEETTLESLGDATLDRSARRLLSLARAKARRCGWGAV
jgi:hypothetical protein